MDLCLCPRVGGGPPWWPLERPLGPPVGTGATTGGATGATPGATTSAATGGAIEAKSHSSSQLLEPSEETCHGHELQVVASVLDKAAPGEVGVEGDGH